LEEPQLLFDISQNTLGKYPQFEPFSIIKLATKGEEREGYTFCDEYGRTIWLGGRRNGDSGSFLAVDEDTKLAFLGEISESENGTFLKVVQDESAEKELNILIKEYSPVEEMTNHTICKCTQKGTPSEWTWDIEQKCHICSSCGAKQY